jgi:hypothetical protein
MQHCPGWPRMNPNNHYNQLWRDELCNHQTMSAQHGSTTAWGCWHTLVP